MGLTTVTLEIKNPYDPNKRVEEDFLVDSGAAYTVLPKRLVKKLQLKPNYSQKFVLADGTKIQRKISSAFVKFEGREIASPVVLGEEKDSPLLGVLTLEALGLVLKRVFESFIFARRTPWTISPRMNAKANTYFRGVKALNF